MVLWKLAKEDRGECWVGTLSKDGVLQDMLGTLGFADWPLSPCLPASLPATRMLPVIIKREVSSEF